MYEVIYQYFNVPEIIVGCKVKSFTLYFARQNEQAQALWSTATGSGTIAFYRPDNTLASSVVKSYSATHGDDFADWEDYFQYCIPVVFDISGNNIILNQSGLWVWQFNEMSLVNWFRCKLSNGFSGMPTPQAGTLPSNFAPNLISANSTQSFPGIAFILEVEKALPIQSNITLKDDDLGIPENRKRYRSMNVLGKLDDNLTARFSIGRTNASPVVGSMLYANTQSAIGVWNQSQWQSALVTAPTSNIYAEADRKVSYRDANNYNFPPTCVGERIQIELEHNTVGNPEIQKLSYSYRVKKDH